MTIGLNEFAVSTVNQLFQTVAENPGRLWKITGQ